MNYGDPSHGIPIIRLEVEAMRHTVQTALTQYAAEMDEQIRAAVDAYCEPDNLNAVVRAAATAALDRAVRDEIDSFFRYGNGRKAVKAAVLESLSRDD